MPGIILLTLIAVVILLAWSWHRLMRICEAANGADWGGRWLNRLDGLNRIFCRRFHRLVSEPLNLPASGGALVASNHVSGLDPLLLIAASPRPLRFVIAREEYDRWWLRWLLRAVGCIPVERTRHTRGAFEAARKALKRSTGARGLRAILENVMTDLMYDLPERDDVREVVITADAINEGKAPLVVTERPRAKREA